MRLGAYPCAISKDSLLENCYGVQEICERHRHRYEFNNAYREKLQDAGMVLSGVSPDGKLVVVVELKDHPWFVATQYHPEFKSQPLKPHPLFAGLIGAAIAHKEGIEV